jgi:homogentisate phytyltransferase/homogentisate geranylgeranyltransferase
MQISRFASALYQFSRPHTMLGTTISILSISLLAVQGAAVTSAMTGALGVALGAALLMNISIVG